MCLTHTRAHCEWFSVPKIQHFQTPALIFAASPATAFTFLNLNFFQCSRLGGFAKNEAAGFQGMHVGLNKHLCLPSRCSFPRKPGFSCALIPNLSPGPAPSSDILQMSHPGMHQPFWSALSWSFPGSWEGFILYFLEFLCIWRGLYPLSWSFPGSGGVYPHFHRIFMDLGVGNPHFSWVSLNLGRFKPYFFEFPQNWKGLYPLSFNFPGSRGVQTLFPQLTLDLGGFIPTCLEIPGSGGVLSLFSLSFSGFEGVYPPSLLFSWIWEVFLPYFLEFPSGGNHLRWFILFSSSFPGGAIPGAPEGTWFGGGHWGETYPTLQLPPQGSLCLFLKHFYCGHPKTSPKGAWPINVWTGP